jgi:hypothetical protein
MPVVSATVLLSGQVLPLPRLSKKQRQSAVTVRLGGVWRVVPEDFKPTVPLASAHPVHGGPNPV